MMRKDNSTPITLPLSEKFVSLQMEGMTTGYPAVFVRFGACNLLCNWKREDGTESACDTIEVWQKWNKTSIDSILGKKEIEALQADAHLIITGGEPLLHQKNIILFFEWVMEFVSNNVYIEVETNGTILPTVEFSYYVNQWNISPKLESSGNLKQLRYNPDVLKSFFQLKDNKCQFKFVITGESDIFEIQRDFDFIPKEQIVLMPAGATRQELDSVRLSIVELCIKHHYRYSDRLHIVVWNQKTGV